MNMLNIKNKLYAVFNNFVNIFSFNSKKSSVEKVGGDDLDIYYIYYDEDCFYLVIDNLKGYFEKNDDNGNKYLTLIFKDKKQEQIFDSIRNRVKELINKVDKIDDVPCTRLFRDYSKEYTVISFDSDDVLEHGTKLILVLCR